MYKPKRTGIGHNKQFGPIQKLSVPDFQHISNYYEQLQNEILEKPKQRRKQMKSFSIRKANNPNQLKGAVAQADMVDDPTKYGYATGNSETNAAQRGADHPPSLLTQEEQEQLKPKEVKVENPWIYEQTHQEYLENIKGLPARHANVIKKHHEVQKDQTFLHKAETGIDKDLATKEAIALLEKEYEIFNTPDMPGVKVLTRYDCWDEEKSIEEWMEEFKSNPGQAHGLSPIYQDYDYCWKPIEIVDYDYKEKKFLVRVCATGQEKYVTRLSLLFFQEDPEKFKQRVNECKQRQEIVEAELRFTNLVDSVPTDTVSTLSKERRFFFLHKSVRPSETFDADKVYPTFKNLLRVVEEEYIRQMKKCIVLKQMEDTNNHEKFKRMKIPIRLSKKTAPYFGVVRCPKYNFSYIYEEVKNAHFSSDEDLVAMTRVFIQKCIDFQDQRYMNTNKQLLKLPRELKDLDKMQNSHHQAVSQNMIVQWRDYLIGEIQDKLRKNNHNFFEANSEVYERSPLKRIITRFEYILNSYLRDFVNLSINDFTDFIQKFTSPKEQNNELWNVSNQPLVIIHLSIQKKAKKVKDKKESKKKSGDKAEEGEEKVEEEEDDKNRIIYKPSIEECRTFILNSMNMIIKSTNNINDLESDLMPFLQKQGKPNFKINSDFAWIKDANSKLSELIDDNISTPNELLDSYKEYEYIMNVDKREMVDNLFKTGPNKDEKVSLQEIKDQITHYDDAYYTIMTLSEDDVKMKLFQVATTKLKFELSDQANKCKDKILDATWNYCLSSTKDCQKQYQDLINSIMKDPVNEVEYVETKSWHTKANAELERLQDVIKDVFKHLLLLDEFSFKYQDAHIEQFWFLKIFPLRVQVALQEGKQTILEKTEYFQNNLQKEQEKFTKDIENYKEQCAQIKTLSELEHAQNYYNQAEEIWGLLQDALGKRKEFNNREDILSQDVTPYNDLDSLISDFKPFYELTQMAFDIKTSFLEWRTGQLMKQDTGLIRNSVSQWQANCNSLRKTLDNEEYHEASDVTMALRSNVDEFSKFLPMVMCITSSAVTDEDWEEITQVLLQDEKIQREKGEGGKVDRNEIKIDDIEKFNLFQFMEEIDDITNKAIKKDSLAQKLKAMKDEMKNFQMSQKEYKSTFLVQEWDEINIKLDDQIVNVQAMNGSSFMKGSLKREAKNWEKKLIDMSELMDKMLKTQRNWMYLEPIFSSGDIANTMPLEYKMFVDVDTHWKSTMNIIAEDPGIIDLVEKENIAKQFDDNNKNLDLIQKKLNDFLEQKRLIFARFFFLANDDLLQILAQTKNPHLVQSHMDKCFEGIAKVIFNDKENVLGMISAEKEEVMFIKPIDVNEGDRKGNVENWMLDIEKQMIESLKKLGKDALLQYPSAKRTIWSTQWPGQIVLAISQIFWTTEVETAIKKGKLKDYLQKLKDQIEGIVQMVRGKLKVMERITLKALTVIDVHARDVVASLCDLQVSTVNDFEWSSQLRYYWEEKDTLMVKMVTAQIKYAYEYLGNSPRLVITALTDRCYRTLLGAKYLNYGGAPEGPAGTGKTESVKDLAKAIAVQCVVFNCSDGLDYLSMAKFFKGLAQSGAWCCFDEFNRIQLEVLSVIAQQIQQIQNAIKNPKIRTFIFEKTELKINRGCAVNITMNPGYAGRSELPDNLKALFRPCAMMVPDYALIAQIELFSFGFSDAAPLSVKVVASLRLSSEQLSSQFHYDFGMRAVKSILNACGRQRQILGDWEEDKICLKSLNDVNIPKFTQNDIPLFKGITSDLFPGVVLPEQDYKQLTDQMINSCKKNNVQPKEYFLDKVIQLYETMMVRHGLMVVGDPYAGKSTNINTLKEAMSTIKDDPDFVNVETHFINPKAITQNQLYGIFDIDTQEWSDGVLAIKIRDCSTSETPDRKWVVFDGPVDAVWIENMNTVLDDNKKLCLTSGAIIKLTPVMTIIFEVDDLSQASPATISRCGMVLMESNQLGHTPWITSYCTKLKALLRNEKVGVNIEKLFHYVMDLSVEFCRVNGKYPCAGNSPFLVNHVIRLIETYMEDYKPKFTDGEDILIPNDIEDKVNNALLFGIIWGIGGVLDEFSRPKFDQFLREMIDGEDVRVKYELDMGPDAEKQYPLTKIPNKLGGDYKSLFDLVFVQSEMKWISWLQTCEKYQVDKDASYLQLSIPTIDTIRMTAICDMILRSKMHCLLVGPTGTGKSIQVNKLLRENYQNEDWIYYQLGFSAQTTSAQTQTIIDGSMEKRRKGILGPEAGKNGVIFVDDLNMPQKEKYGAQPPIELLRQWMDYGGWYNINSPEREFTKIEGVRFVGAMGPPGSGRNSISSRYIRHFNVLYIEPYSKDSLKNIFSTIMDWLFLSKSTPIPFPQAVQSMKESLVLNTILIYNSVQEQFKPTPAKSHYSYNLRDVSKVFQGISKSSGKAILKEDDMLKLWAHECQRVFQDRLINQGDRDHFQDILTKQIKDKFKKEWSNIVQVEPLIFGSFVPMCYPNNDTTQKPYRDVYCELWDREKLSKACEYQLQDYNQMNSQKKMNLVLFEAAIEHCTKINRIITTQFGHALLMGVGGSGRKSLTNLAIHIASFEPYEIEITKAYDFKEWRSNMKNQLFYNCGVEEKTMVFILNDTQIIIEAFLEDINNILNNGEIPNLYKDKEDEGMIIEAMRDNPLNKNKGENEIMHDFLTMCKENIHIVLAMSPIGDDIKRRLRMFPSLVNCCAINYFLPWPQQALHSVAMTFLKDVPDLKQINGVVDICVDMQTRVTNMTQKYYEEYKRYYYVTPTSYLVLIKAFQELLSKKGGQIDNIVDKYTKGIQQLASAKEQVGILEAELIKMLPELEQAKIQTGEKIIMVQEKKKEVAEKTEIVKKEEAVAQEILQRAEAMKKDADFEVQRVMPIYHLAIRAVSQLKRDDVNELSGFKTATKPVQLVCETLIIIFNMEKKIIYKGVGRDKHPEIWETAKKFILNNQLLSDCKNYPKDNIQPAVVEKLRPILESPEYEDRILKNASTAAWGLGKWVKAMVQYDDAMKIVKPKRAEAEKAKGEAAEAQAMWDAAVEKLRAVEAEMKLLVQDLDESEAKKKYLQDEYDMAVKKLERANALITKLKDEEKNWEKSLEVNIQFKKCLVGDIIISAGIIAYLGIFSSDYRNEAIQNWMELMNTFEIQSTNNFSLQVVLGDNVKIQKWHVDQLPQEQVSIDNAIIMENSERWPLMIDPQTQGNIWIKSREKGEGGDDHLYIIKPTTETKIVSRILENTIRFGYPLLLEDANESFDPLLEPLLAKNIIKNRGQWQIKLGEGTVEYDKKFKFYITTKLSKPHYPPEVCVKVTMLNFMVTEDGLQDQMLNEVVKHEDPKKMEQKNKIQIEQAEDNKTKALLEDDILGLIADNQKNLLEDDELIDKLDDSKLQCQAIDQKAEDAKITIDAIQNMRKHFEQVGRRVSRMFFVIIQIMNVNSMYQYSLRFFKDIFIQAMMNASDIEKGKKNERKNFFMREFVSLLYENICRSLFEQDKLLFSFLLCLKIMDETEGALNWTEVKFLMQGGTRVEMSRPNPTGEGGWMTDKTWSSILQVSEEFSCFKGFDENIEINLSHWERIYNSSNPHLEVDNWPEPYNELTLMRQGMLLRILRPDKVVPIIQALVSSEKELGKEFIMPPAFNLAKSYKDSANNKPIIIVLSPGADPMSEISKLALTQQARPVPISLGQGQSQIAKDAIIAAQEDGQQWIILQNCHLAPSFMPTLDALIELIPKINESKFRIWMTAMPCDHIPVNILQNSVKLTIEPPKGLKNNIMNSYAIMNEKEFDGFEKEKPFKCLMWGLCFFNAMILERRKYGPLGWNIPYQFSNSDLLISQAQLQDFLLNYDEIPWVALKYMVSEANYGGRVTDPNDRTTINLILEDFYNPDMLKTKHKLSESGVYYVPEVGDLQSYKDFISSDDMPINDLTEIFGLHENAEITSAINTTNEMLAMAMTLISSGGSAGGGDGKTPEQIINETANEILDKLPLNFDMEYASKKHKLCYEDSMNTVLQQELLRYNQLLGVVRTSLINVGKAIKGEVPMSPELEDVTESLFHNTIPAVWDKVSYPSLKPLASYIADFLERLKFMQSWIDNGAPTNFWISGFFFTQSFLTGAKQNYARKYVIAIDHIDFDFTVISDESKYDLANGPEDGVFIFGLYVEGARWDDSMEAIEESNPKVLFTQMRPVWILPKEMKSIDYGHSFKCPVYKTARRAGTLSTTGHSTNFVCYIYLPIQEKHEDSHWIKRGVAMLTQLSD